MASLDELYPIVIIQDRYGGGYSGGGWIAIAEAEDRNDQRDRIDWVWAGALGEDVPAMTFWEEHKHSPWIAVGDTPDHAVKNLVERHSISQFDVVRLKVDLSEDALKTGDQGAVVDVYTDPPGYEIEFTGSDGEHIGKWTTIGVKPEHLELIWKYISPETKA